MSLLNVGARALLANQVALQTTGHNIANVNVAGYSRQSVSQQTVQGQFTGGGYIGQGVSVETILRNHNELLTRQAAAAGSTQAADVTRAERLTQMQNIFSGGTAGLGASITDMMNSLGDVVAAPTDITARTVTLTRMNEMAARMRSAAEQLGEIQYSVNEQLQNDVVKINSLSKSIADVNDQIARTKGNGQTPNDLLDRRDQLIRDLNQYVQTTQVPADDGTVGLFVANSQPLVLGTTAATLSLAESKQFSGSGQMRLFFSQPGSAPVELDDNMLGGGEVSGLLRFANNDLTEGRNLLGRMAQAIGMTMNAQQKLGLTLDGQPGKELFSVPTSAPAYTSGTAAGVVQFTDATRFAASDYEVRFTTPPAGQVVRLSDGKATAFTDLGNLAGQQIDGLTFNLTAAGTAGERVLFKPFSATAANIETQIYSPRDLAAANPVNAAMGTSNSGSLQLAKLAVTGQPGGLVLPANGNPAATPPTTGGVLLQFNAGPPTTYDAFDGRTNPPTAIATGQPFVTGQPISINGWSITLQGTPKTGDTVTVGNALDPQYGDAYKRNAGNATALAGLRDVKMFDESSMSDGYAGLMAQIGTRAQSALYAADLSSSIASNLEADRTAVSGVNLDEEAAKLIQYQQAYQASAKMLQIAQSIFDSLIQSMGR
ncbi:flagellar hook-associated protein FlgK [Paracidovorax wautersii]|uniref:Flagellar hook-associated protein 1 n=1 Tax=Paracidovorax wautersii TaxID=1177982 RepID=A0ABU1IAX2_9BURK|nr:flagellar hook-associated protein FlgK [Paracidovorax wautersii]MDR6214086.1 flagellar hook-associated protein 1 FlgK [Paracidovorax wautersii]